MADSPPYDPRIIANEIIDVAHEFEFEVTHLSLQKIVYFLHESYLLETGQPLCMGFFEAWKHGPVHPQLWSSYKSAGRDAIKHHLYATDIVTGEVKNLPKVKSAEVRRHIVASSLKWLRFSAPSLVGKSHARNSPWDLITRRNGGQREYGGRITNEVILTCKLQSLPAPSPTDEDDLYEQPPA